MHIYIYTYAYTHTSTYIHAYTDTYIQGLHSRPHYHLYMWDHGPYGLLRVSGYWKAQTILGPPNVALLRALWPLVDGIWAVLKGSWGVLDVSSFGRLLEA